MEPITLTPLAKNDLNWCLTRMPKAVRELLEEFPGRVVAAGGFVRACVSNEPINDLDLFPADEDLAVVLANRLAQGHAKFLYQTQNAYTVTRPDLPFPVQFIHRWLFQRPEDVLNSFDFTIAQAALWMDPLLGWTSLASQQFYQDLAGKRLVYLSPERNEDAGGSLLRVLKFYQRGYRIPLDSLGAVIARLVKGGQLTIHGSESTIANQVTRLLREVDPVIDPTHSSHLPPVMTDEELQEAAAA